MKISMFSTAEKSIFFFLEDLRLINNHVSKQITILSESEDKGVFVTDYLDQSIVMDLLIKRNLVSVKLRRRHVT